MTSIKLFIKETQQIGPIHVWPLKVTGVSSHLYSVPPFGDKLIFSEYDDGDGGRVNVIEVHNPTDEDFMIPSGWIVGANLLQVRTFNHSELVKAGESILADVSCVEKGRWGDGQNETDGGRAPFSVIGAGWDYDAERRLWVIDRNSRQSRVWSQVSRQESRSGVRETSSLQQIMMEDSEHAAVQSQVQQISRDTLKTYDEQNGFLVAVDGEPLLMEVFSDSRNIENTIQETIRAISFDIAHLDFEPALDSDVRRFVEEANLGGLSPTQIDDWASQFAGGNHGVDTRATKDQDGLLIHSISLNRRHRILLEV
jgi:hypothetical protein